MVYGSSAEKQKKKKTERDFLGEQGSSLILKSLCDDQPRWTIPGSLCFPGSNPAYKQNLLTSKRQKNADVHPVEKKEAYARK